MPITTPIKRVVIIVKENHAFDNYFGKLPGVDGNATLPAAPNPPTSDPRHDHTAWLNRARSAVRLQYSEADVPEYYEYARRFTICDRYFTEVAGPSTPNHLMLIAADSPVINNPHSGYRGQPIQTYDLPSLPDRLDAANLTWRNYGGYAFQYITSLGNRNKRQSADFAVDAANGDLPAVSWLYAPSAQSEHPLDNVTDGMAWTVAQVDAIVKGGLWSDIAIFITWDDWGGWYDHVEPPNVEQWTDGSQFRYGTRVGCLVLSPYAKRGYVSKVLHSHISLVRFVEDLYTLPSLNLRDRAADGMGDCFDFTQPPDLTPPPSLGSAAKAGGVKASARRKKKSTKKKKGAKKSKTSKKAKRSKARRKK